MVSFLYYYFSIAYADDIVPAEIRLMADKKSVPLYMKLLESGSEKKRDIRIVLVGQKETGKTSLLKRLFGDDKSMMGEIDSTNGIEIHRITCKANNDDGIWNKLDGITITYFFCGKNIIASLDSFFLSE